MGPPSDSPVATKGQASPQASSCTPRTGLGVKPISLSRGRPTGSMQGATCEFCSALIIIIVMYVLRLTNYSESAFFVVFEPRFLLRCCFRLSKASSSKFGPCRSCGLIADTRAVSCCFPHSRGSSWHGAGGCFKCGGKRGPQQPSCEQAVLDLRHGSDLPTGPLLFA